LLFFLSLSEIFSFGYRNALFEPSDTHNIQPIQGSRCLTLWNLLCNCISLYINYQNQKMML
jgi:hypothetical protein